MIGFSTILKGFLMVLVLLGGAPAQSLADQFVFFDEVFTFEEEPLLASLITCLGIQSEIGNPERDRLSVPLGIDLQEGVNPWKTEIITHKETQK